MQRVRLAHPADFEGFRTAARSLVARQVPPAAVIWEVAGEEGLPLAETAPETPSPLRVPRAFPELAEKIVCHRAPERFALLHEALARLQTNPRLLECREDPLVARLEAMAASVGRDLERMRARVRFRETTDDAGPHLTAWFEPEHHIARLSAGFFLRRFASQRWTILTPDESIHWDGAALRFLPGATRPEAAQEDPLDRLRAEAATCTMCPLHAPATQTVFGEGPADARLMIVGEQPGDQEDLAGRPFVGPAGQLLDRALAQAGIDRGTAYVTNAVKHFKFEPRGKRRLHQSPNPSEIETCRWWLAQERELVKPRLVLMLGASAARALLDRPVAVGRERGKPLALPDGARAFLTVHPSYLLRIENPAAAQAEYARFVADLRAAQALAEAA